MVTDLADLDAGEEKLGKLEANLGIVKADFDRAARSLSSAAMRRRRYRGLSWPNFRR